MMKNWKIVYLIISVLLSLIFAYCLLIGFVMGFFDSANGIITNANVNVSLVINETKLYELANNTNR